MVLQPTIITVISWLTECMTTAWKRPKPISLGNCREPLL